MLKKLRIKMICILMVVVTVLLCAALYLTIFSTTNKLEEESFRMLQSLTGPEYGLMFGFEDDDLPKFPYFVMQQTISGKTVVYGSGYYDLRDEAFLKNVWSEVSAQDEAFGVLSKYGLRYLRTSSPAGNTIACIDITTEQELKTTLIRNCCILGFFSLLIFFVISVLLARWAVKPVDIAWKNQQKFVADASHELKTPLTVILTNAELLQNQDLCPDQITQYSDGILTMSHQMRGLVESLLDLARVEGSTHKAAYEKMDLSRLISDSVLPFEALFFEAGHSLEVTVEPGIFVRGNAGQIVQVLEILLDNARKYAYPDSSVSVSLKKYGHLCKLAVINEGPEIHFSDLKKIFNRFYRIDEARAMNHSYGLGLSIAQRIIHEHKGKIWAESSSGTNRFYVQLYC